MGGTIIHLAAVTLLLYANSIFTSPTFAQTDGYEAVSIAKWTTWPMVGALGASLMAFLLNRVSERRGAVAGRVICSMVFGVGIPRALIKIHPWIKEMSLDPLLLLISGFVFGLLGYAAAVYVVDKFFNVAPAFVDRGVEQLANLTATKVVEKTAANVEAQPGVVEKAMEDLAERTSQKVVEKTQANADAAATQRLY